MAMGKSSRILHYKHGGGGCARKRHYSTKEQAEEVAGRHEGTNIYPCTCGAGWLLGHRIAGRRYAGTGRGVPSQADWQAIRKAG